MPFQTKVRDQVLIEFEGSFYILSPTALHWLWTFIFVLFFLQLSFCSLRVWKVNNQLDDPWLHMWAECCSKFVQLLKWAKIWFRPILLTVEGCESEKVQKKGAKDWKLGQIEKENIVSGSRLWDLLFVNWIGRLQKAFFYLSILSIFLLLNWEIFF